MQNFLERYSRTILLEGFDFASQQKISNSKVLLIGAGGLSSSIISILVASGISEIIVVEHDVLELSNLQRQFIFKTDDIGFKKVLLVEKFAKGLNPQCVITPFEQIFSEETFGEISKLSEGCNAIIDATDSFESRILSTKLSVQRKIPLFTGAAIGFIGHVYSFFPSAHGPCYACLFGHDAPGREVATCSNTGVFPALPSVVGGIMAAQVLAFLSGLEGDFSKFTLINLLESKCFRELKIEKNLQCKICKSI